MRFELNLIKNNKLFINLKKIKLLNRCIRPYLRFKYKPFKPFVKQPIINIFERGLWNPYLFWFEQDWFEILSYYIKFIVLPKRVQYFILFFIIYLFFLLFIWLI